MRRPLRRIIIAALIAVGPGKAVYLVAANVFLNTSLAPETINRKPEKFQIHWRSGWSLWPGMAVLSGVETRGRSKSVEWHARLDSVRTTFYLRPLFHRTVHLASVKAEGVIYRQRRILAPGQPSRIPASELPPIPASLDIPGAASRSPGPAKPPGLPWRVLADGITCDLSELWIDRFRLLGHLRVETAMDLRVRGRMEFPRIRLQMASGDLLAGEGVIFKELGLDADATLHSFIPRQAKRLRFFRNLSGRFVFHSKSASLFFLEAYFRKTPWLHFNEHAGGRMVLQLDHGVLQPGTTLDIANDQVDVGILDRRLTGKGVITGRVTLTNGAPVSQITAHLIEFQVAPVGSDKPFARGRDSVIVATSDKLDLSDPFTDLKVSFDLPEAHILDLGFYNSMIPPGSKFHLISGTGTLRYHLEGSQDEHSLHGDIALSTKDAVARFESYEMRGDFTLKPPLRQASPKELLFDISGTRLDLRKKNPDWSATILFPKAKMKFSDPLAIDARVGFDLQDTRPLVAMFDALKGAPGWVERMMIIANVKGTAALQGGHDRVAINDLEVTGEKLKALADLSFGKQSKEGILYVHLHGFSLGVELKKGEKGGKNRDLKLLRPLHWFEQERARRKLAHP